MSNACFLCGGKGIIPKVPGDYRIMITCHKCSGTGRSGGHTAQCGHC